MNNLLLPYIYKGFHSLILRSIRVTYVLLSNIVVRYVQYVQRVQSAQKLQSVQTIKLSSANEKISNNFSSTGNSKNNITVNNYYNVTINK